MILMTCPRRAQQGGVINFVEVISKHLKNEIKFFEVGAHNIHESWLEKINHTLIDIARLFKIFSRKKNCISLIHLNPSMGWFSIIRDGTYLLMAKWFKFPVVVMFHGWDNEVVCDITRLNKCLFSSIYNYADSFIVLASQFKNDLVCLGIRKPSFLLTTAVEDATQAFVENKTTNIKKLSRQNVKLLFLSRIENKKGIFEVLDCLHLLLDQGFDIRLIVSGNGSCLDKARNYASHLNIDSNVTFTGYIKGEVKYEVFRSSDIFIFPSHTEGMPTNVLEAMFFGLPVVVTPVGGLVDFFEDGRMGFFVPKPDPEMMAEKIKQIINDPETANKMSQYNREYAQANFTASAVAQRLEKIHSKFMLIR